MYLKTCIVINEKVEGNPEESSIKQSSHGTGQRDARTKHADQVNVHVTELHRVNKTIKIS